MDEQLLKDFIATAQKDSYNWEAVFAKFPELKSYDQQLLKDYVATAEQENYNYEVVNPKFPEFGFKPVAQDLKKKDQKDSTELPSGDSSLGSSSSEKSKPIEIFQGFTPEQKKQMGEDVASQSYMGMTASADQLKKDDKKSYAENLGTNLIAGVNDVDKMIASIPEAVYDIFSIPQNALAYATGLDISVNSEKTKADLGIENPMLNYYKEEGERLDQEIQKFNETNYKSSSVYENITKGNYADAFELLGSGIVRSAPVSVAMMAGGATLTPAQLSAAGTVAFYEQNADQLREENPEASDIENNIKALTMSAAETVFSAIGEGQIGAVYRDIIKKEGVEAGTQIFKDGLVETYKGALRKYGVPVGLIGEGVEEAATQVTQNMVSGKPAFEGAADAFIIGGGSGAVFTAPITLKNAKDRIANEVAKFEDKKQINTILDGSESKLHTLYDTPKDAAINEQQLKVASLSKSRDLLEKSLKQSVKKGEITQDQAKQSLYVFDKTQQVAGQLRNVDIDEPTKVVVANLLKEREALSDKIQGQDPALSVLEKERINQINEEIKKAIIESKNKPTTTEEALVDVASETSNEIETPVDKNQEDDIIEFSDDELEALKEDVGKFEEQGTLAENVGEKAYVGDEEGNIKIEGQQYVFESNTTIKELGNINEVGDSFLASFGISKFPPEGVVAEQLVEGKKPNLVTIDGKEYTFLRNRKPEKGEAVIVVKDNESGLQRVIRGNGAEKALKDISLQRPAPEIKLDLKTEGKPVVEKTKEELKREARADRKKAREEFEAKSLEELTQMQEKLDKESAQFESELLDTIAKESKKESRLLVKSEGKEFMVAKKPDGQFSVSQKNSAGKFVGIKDAASRKKAVDLFNEIKNSKDKERIKQAEDLASEFKQEQSDKILAALDKAIAATSTKGKAYDATLGLPLMVTNTILKIVRTAYKGSKSLAYAIKEAQKFLIQEGYDNVSDYALKKFVLENINKPTDSKSIKTEESPTNKSDSTPSSATSASENEAGDLKVLKQIIKEVKLAKSNIKEKRKLISDVIKQIEKSGKLSAAKAEALVKRVNNLNVESFEQLVKFIDYAQKIFADANYKDKLSKAKSTKAALKKLSKNKSNKYDGNLAKLTKRFLAIDPSLVEDIDAYNDLASNLAAAIKGSSAKEFKPTIEIKAVDAYIENAMAYQEEKLTAMMREQVEALLGVDGSNLTYDEMIKMLQPEAQEDVSAQKEEAIRSAATKLFDMYSTIISDILKTGVDAAGEEVDIKESKKELVKRFVSIDINKLSVKDAIRAVDALQNFIVNGSTAKMEDTVRKYEGEQKAAKLEKMGIKTKRLKVYFSKRLGRFLSSQFATQPLLFEELFGGQKAAEIVEREMGVTDLKSNKSKAQSIVNKMVADYTSKFLKTKPNGQGFNTALNGIERGMVAFVSRADAADEQKSFEDRKSLIEQSIDVLKVGNEDQQKKAQVYQEVYDKILKDAKTAQEVKSNADAVNVEAVDFWIDKWAENYEDLADVAENIHNSVLGKDISYTPDKFSSLGPDRGLKVEAEDDFDIMGSAFIQNSGNVYKKKTGRLMEATTENKLPSNRYVDLSFDSNNANLMLDALIDVKTAGDVRQVDAFMKSDAFQKIMPNAEERQLLQARIDLMVRNFRNKNHYNYDEIAKLSKSLNRIAALGASYALGGIGQPLKQVIPVAINTMANGGIPSFSIMFDNAKRDFITNSGEAVANRGTESVSEFKAIDSLLDKAAESTPEKAMQLVEKVSGMYLKLFLQKPDAYIAQASWLAYYEKSLKKQGEDTENINYSTHKLNKEAAQYATRMVDRQQNISDADLKGKVFSANDGLSHIMTKVILPFASFRINQWLRMNNDLGVVTSKTSMKEDRKAALKSLAGFGVEVATFNAIGTGLSYLTYALATSILRDATGSDKDDEDKKKIDEIDQKYASNLVKGRGSSVIQDVFSPIPLTDPLFEYAAYQALDATQSFLDIDEAERKNIFKPKWSQEGLKALGSLGIAAERTKNLYDIGHAWATGKITTEAFGKATEKDVRQRDKEVLGPLTTLALVNSVGALPAEFNSAQKTIFKEITKQASTKDEQELSKEKEKKAATKEKLDQKLEDIDKAIKRTSDEDVKDALIKMKKHIEDGTKPADAEKEDEDRENAKKMLRRIRSNRDGSKKRKSGFGSNKFGSKPFGSK